MKIILSLLIVALTSLTARAQTIYAYGLYDTNDQAAGNYIQIAAARIDTFISAVSRSMGPGYRLVTHKLQGATFSIDGLRSTINPITSYEPNDIVLLFYIGHGVDDPDSKYPSLNLPDRERKLLSYPAQRIVDGIRSRKPGTLLSIFEACNIDPSVSVPDPGIDASFDEIKLRAIFTAKFGVAIATAKEGQLSFVTGSGGVYSNRLLDLFRVGAKTGELPEFIQSLASPIRVNSRHQQYQEPWLERLW